MRSLRLVVLKLYIPSALSDLTIVYVFLGYVEWIILLFYLGFVGLVLLDNLLLYLLHDFLGFSSLLVV